MNSSGASTPPSNHIRKRRAHKRSRNGCMTCKQRHIRCDELKPVCTNCLTRGGDCGYPDAGGKSGSGPGSGSGSTELRTTSRVKQLRVLQFPSSPSDPFDALPVKMPHRSMELFNHFTNYRIFSRTLVPKCQDSACVGIVLGGPGVFRAGLLMTALHFSWMSPSGSLAHTDMEETYLHHKLEAMRHVNELVADSQKCTSDDCIALIAALAMAESGMGDITAAEAHLKGLFTLVNMRRPEEWQHRFWGILQRIILVTGSFIAAAKRPEMGGYKEFISADDDGNFDGASPQNPFYPQPTGPVFSTAPFIATRLSPFYMGSTPDLEACKADAEAEVLTNALRRLSSLTGTDDSAFASIGPYGRTTTSLPFSPSRRRSDAKSRGTKRRLPHPSESLLPQNLAFPTGGYDSTNASATGTGTSNSPSADETYEASRNAPCYFVRDVTNALLSDTDAYIVSLLFKPHPLYPEAHKTTQVEGLESDNPSHDHPARSRPPAASPWVAAAGKVDTPDLQTSPYASLPPDQFPSSSRAWASAAYLYLHVILEELWFDRQECSQSRKASNPDMPFSASVAPGTPTAGRIPQNSPEVRKDSSASQQQPPIKRQTIDNPYFLRLLLDTLKADIRHSEQAMRIGTYSKELWIWKVIVGAYTLAVVKEEAVWVETSHYLSGGGEDGQTGGSRPSPGIIPSGAKICPEGARVTKQMADRLGNRRSRPQPSPQPPNSQRPSPASQAQSPGFPFGPSFSGGSQQIPDRTANTRQPNSNPSSTRSSPSRSSHSSSSSPGRFQNEEHQHQPPNPSYDITEAEKNYVPALRAFFSSCMRSWSRATRVTSWQGAKENISRIAWPEHLFEVEAVSAKLWEDAIQVAVDPSADQTSGKGKATATSTPMADAVGGV